MPEIGAYGSVRGGGGNILTYSDARDYPMLSNAQLKLLVPGQVSLAAWDQISLGWGMAQTRE